MSNDLPDESIWVTTQRESYPIHIGYGLLIKSALFHSFLCHKNVFILSHPKIAELYLDPLTTTCMQAGARQVRHLLVPEGDNHKTLQTASDVWDKMLAAGFHRDTIVIGLGGGVIGDLAGFCAACFMRGVNVIQCPTSLLSQIDAAIGGKTGVNHPYGKNLIGAFHQPTAVIIDLDTLTSLPTREYIAGLGELIKYGITLDATLFDWLEDVLPQILARDRDVLPKAVKWACELKANIVAQDEKEKGQRLFLNFGHTVAHALENMFDYKQYLHGEAVAIGMVVVMTLSLQRGWIEASLWDRVITLLKRAQLPISLPQGICLSTILEKIKHDKKHSHQTLQWILLKALGDPVVCTDVTVDELEQALVKCGAKS